MIYVVPWMRSIPSASLKLFSRCNSSIRFSIRSIDNWTNSWFGPDGTKCNWYECIIHWQTHRWPLLYLWNVRFDAGLELLIWRIWRVERTVIIITDTIMTQRRCNYFWVYGYICLIDGVAFIARCCHSSHYRFLVFLLFGLAIAKLES